MGNSKSKSTDTNISIDHGSLFPQSNTYSTQPKDWNFNILKTLITQRRLAPFYKGLEDADADYQTTTCSSVPLARGLTSVSSPDLGGYQGSGAVNTLPRISTTPKDSPASSFKQTLLRNRSGSLNSMFNIHKPDHPETMILDTVVELKDLYTKAIECPICFLFYPRNINYSRCCLHPLCTECFVQIKRSENNLDPTSCPFCTTVDFGVIYGAVGTEFFKEIVEESGQEENKKKRKKVYEKDDEGVVTSDAIRPDFIEKQKANAIARASAANQRSLLALALAGNGRDLPPELTSAAQAAADMIESMQFYGLDMTQLYIPTSGTSNRRRRRELQRLVADAERFRSINGDFTGNATGGGDLEEMMLMEAMRRSMVSDVSVDDEDSGLVTRRNDREND